MEPGHTRDGNTDHADGRVFRVFRTAVTKIDRRFQGSGNGPHRGRNHVHYLHRGRNHVHYLMQFMLVLKLKRVIDLNLH